MSEAVHIYSWLMARASQGGVVTLQGSVNTDREKAAVERIARRHVGVKKVVDRWR